MAVQTWIYGKPDVQYEGCVLSTYEHNGYEDSDFYAICWDDKKQAVVEVEYDTTRCGAGGKAEIDATDEVLRKAYRYYWKLGRSLFDGRTNIEQGYNPYPCCRYYEDTSKWPNSITQECFECRKRTRKEDKQNDKTRV